MKRFFLLLFVLLSLSSHDMYLKLDTYFLKPNTVSSIKLFNGTFEKSDNVITRNRMIDVSLVGNGNRLSVDTTQWSEVEGMTILNFNTGEEGTWVAGVSTLPRNIEMKAEAFNGYLEHDGVLDMLEWRKNNNALDQDAVEKYSKHVKTIFQVGDKLSDDWKANLGYPIEFIPLSNPYDIHTGHDLQVQLLWQGKPLSNQLVYVGFKEGAYTHGDGHSHSHEHGDSHTHTHEHDSEDDHHHDLTQFRTDAEGKFSFKISHQGVWYLRTIYLTASEETGLTHESNWATLTFEVGEGHSHSHDAAHNHHHHHHDEEGIFGLPSYAYWIASLALIFVLFFWFNSKQK